MAYAAPLKPKEDENGQPGLSASSGEIVGGNAGNAGNAQAAPAMPVNTGGSQFPDVSRYLSQNKDAGNRLASKVGSNVVQAGNQARNLADQQKEKLNTATQSFNQNYGANRVAPVNQDVLNRATQNPTSFFQRDGQPLQRDPGRGGTPTDPQPYPTRPYEYGTETTHPRTFNLPINSTATMGATPTVSDQAGFDQFKAMRDASYAGPQDLGYTGDYGALNQAASAAGDVAGKAKTDSGRLDLLRNLYGGGVNSPGVANLDNFLLRGGGAQGVLGNAAKQNTDIGALATGLQGQESAAQADALSKVAAENTAATGVRNQVQDAFLGPQGAYTQFDNDYDQRLAAAQAEGARINPLISELNRGDIDPERVRIKENLGNITNVASQSDYDRLQALNQLLGTNLGL